VSEIASRWLHKLGVRVGGKPATIHKGRHRYASEVYQATHDLRAVQELLGHESPATTAIYTAPDDAATLAAVISLSERLAQPAKPAERPPPGLTRAPDPTVLPAGRDAALDTAAGLIEASMGEADYHPFRDTVLDSLDRPELLELARVLVHHASAWLGFWVVERVEDTQAAFDAEVAREVALIRYAATLDPSSGGGFRHCLAAAVANTTTYGPPITP